MTNSHDGNNDPLNFMRNLWGNAGFTVPSMAAPTFDIEELDKRIADLKTVEGWLRMNLSMLQMTIQGLEMQRATVSVVQAMGEVATKAQESAASAMPKHEPRPAPQEAKPEPAPNPESAADADQTPLWPWAIMQQLQEAMQQANTAVTTAGAAAAKTKPKAKASAPRKPAGKSAK